MSDFHFYNHSIRRTAKKPNVCPHCHIINNVEEKWWYDSKDTDLVNCYISAWECSNDKCLKIFMALYKEKEGEWFIFTRFLNWTPKWPNWPEVIINLKDWNELAELEVQETKSIKQNRFMKTYLQSLQAEQNWLDEIAWMGFRKAIEYLVKDWAIQKNPKEKQLIQKMWLKKVIDDYYDWDLKWILERATWLWNDQSHYIKLFEEFDIEHLKELINLIMVELDRQEKMKHYLNIDPRK